MILTHFRQSVCWVIWRNYRLWSRSLLQKLMREKPVFHIHNSHQDFLSRGSEPVTFYFRENKPRYEITLAAYKCVALICMSSMRLLQLTHYLTFQIYTTAEAITATNAHSYKLKIDTFT